MRHRRSKPKQPKPPRKFTIEERVLISLVEIPHEIEALAGYAHASPADVGRAAGLTEGVVIKMTLKMVNVYQNDLIDEDDAGDLYLTSKGVPIARKLSKAARQAKAAAGGHSDPKTGITSAEPKKPTTGSLW